MEKVRITHLDGKLPNLALMKLSAWHRENGDDVYFSKSPYRDLFEPKEFDRFYGSTIFTRSINVQNAFRTEFPNAVFSGTGSDSKDEEKAITVEYEELTYSIYPSFKHSLTTLPGTLPL